MRRLSSAPQGEAPPPPPPPPLPPHVALLQALSERLRGWPASLFDAALRTLHDARWGRVETPGSARAKLTALLQRSQPAAATRVTRLRALHSATAAGASPRALMQEALTHERCAHGSGAACANARSPKHERRPRCVCLPARTWPRRLRCTRHRADARLACSCHARRRAHTHSTSALNLLCATRCYELALAAGPDLAWVGTPEGTDALCRLCKQLSDRGWHAYAAAHGLPCARHATPPPGPLSDGLVHIVDAVALAEEALVLAPRSARAHTTMAVASGRLALFTEDNRTRVALCNRIRAEAEAAVALDPSEDVAHHALGRWHYEVRAEARRGAAPHASSLSVTLCPSCFRSAPMPCRALPCPPRAQVASLNPVVRLVVRHFYGGDVTASHAQAVEHYEAACQLAPQRLTHRTELGKARAERVAHSAWRMHAMPCDAMPWTCRASMCAHALTLPPVPRARVFRLVSRAQALMKLGRRREALQSFKAALSCDVEARAPLAVRPPIRHGTR
jgi:tetratricopeptide (TPR) repeat protein